MYIRATRLVNLGLPKAFIQLFCMQVHVPYVQARRDVFFQIKLYDFSGVLPLKFHSNIITMGFPYAE